MLNFCPNCGTKAEGEWIVCPYCGGNLQSEEQPHSFQPPTPPVSPYPQQPPQPIPIIYPPKQSNTYGIIALIFGFLGMFLFPYIASIVAIIVGSIGRKKDDSPKMATGGLVLGIIGLVGWVIVPLIINWVIIPLII